MNQAKTQMLAAGLLAVLTACGCQTVGVTARGQDPEPNFPPANHKYHQPIEATVSEIQDCYHEHHNTTTTTYYNANPRIKGAHHGPPGPGYGDGTCQHWYPGTYANLGTCPHGMCGGHGCGQCGNGLNWYPHHGHTYSYERPNDLVYPPANNAIGGAVVYPYYTHKGPSDFFRK